MELFVTVMTSKTLQQAAERLQVSQPAITKAVRQLEREASLSLFLRSAAGVRPTAAALRLVPYVQRVVDEMRGAQKMAAHLRDEAIGHVRVAATDTSLPAFLPRAVARLRERWPDASLEIVPDALPSRVLEQVEHGQVDIGISQRPGRKVDPASDIESRALCEQPLAVVFPRDHAFARLSALRARDLAGVQIAHVRAQTTTYDLMEAACRSEGVALQIFAETNSSFAVCGLVASSGIGVGLINPLLLEGGLFPDLEWRPFSPRITIRTFAHFLKASPLPEVPAHLVECLAEIGASMGPLTSRS